MNNQSTNTANSSLDEIVMEVLQYKNREEDSSGRQTIIVEKETGEILEALPFFGWGKKLRFLKLTEIELH